MLELQLIQKTLSSCVFQIFFDGGCSVASGSSATAQKGCPPILGRCGTGGFDNELTQRTYFSYDNGL